MSGKFYNLDAATLSSLKTKVVAAIEAVLIANQSYSIAGRTFTRANLSELQEMLAELAAAETFAAGHFSRFVRSDMSNAI